MNQTVEKAKAAVERNIDTKLVLTGLATVVVVGTSIAVLSKMGKFGQILAGVMKGGK